MKTFAQEVPSLIASFVSGAMDGTAETVKWHYDRFERVFPNANQNYWNPKLSSQNKYKDGITANGPRYFGSTTFLVWTTDGYHMTRMVRNWSIIGAILLHPREKKKFKYVLKDVLIHTLTYQAGFHATYTILFK